MAFSLNWERHLCFKGISRRVEGLRRIINSGFPPGEKGKMIMKITNIYKTTATLFFLMVAILVPLQEAWGQETTTPRFVTGDKYRDNSSETITHKAAKWFDLREHISSGSKAMDRFDDDTKWQKLQDKTTEVQAAHTYLDTIYVHKGDSISLEIPDKLGNQSRVESYQRWYNFRTDGTFRTMKTGNDEVWDLLTPSDANTYYRYANGYVGKPKGPNMYKVMFYVPTDEEFNVWFGSTSLVQPDNNYYLVACDVSAYTDYTEEFDPASSSSSSFSPSGDDKTYEPTLTHRVIFYIVTVDGRENDVSSTWKNGMGRLVTEKSSYTGGPGVDKKFLEEYNISFPFTRVSNKTLELVALSKDARAYAIPDEPVEGDQDTPLDVQIEENNSAGITLATESKSLSGMERIIHFNYPKNNSTDGTQHVNDNNSTATIYVTKKVNGTTYNLVRYNLTFVRDTRLLTQTQLSQIEAGTITDNNLRYYQFRTDKYLEENYELLTSLDFDYDPDVAEMYGQPEYYQFPLPWTANSYSFFDGSEGADFKNTNKYPEWGYYSIMSTFMEKDQWSNGSKNTYAKPLPGSTYHLYVDASDRPGVIARLPFRDKLCTGSELFVTAWVKSAGWGSTQDDAGMLFSIMGVREDKVLGTVYEPIYRHASSQIRRTDYLKGGMPGTGGSTNEWWQVYFSFKVNENTNYASYALQIDNNSASTDGGDMYIDDIRVYMASPGAEVTQLRPTCADDETLLNIKISWDRLLSRRGAQELTGDNESYWEGIDFCFVDTLKYHEAINAGKGEAEAITESVVKVWSTVDGTGKVDYSSLYFNLNFGKNTVYGSNGNTLASQNPVTFKQGDITIDDGNGFYCYEEGEGDNKQRYLSVDFYSELEPNRTYWMLISQEGIDGIAPTMNDFINIIGKPCGITSEFRVTSQNLLKINGEIVSPELAYCEGQELDFTVDLLVPGDDGYVPYEGEEKVYFDWFFGTETEYLTKYKVNNGLLEEDNTSGVSLKDALAGFRSVYSYDDQGLPKDLLDSYNDYDEEGKTFFTEAMYNLIKYYVNADRPSGGRHNPLVLGVQTLSLTLLETLNLVVTPIQIIISDPNIMICWGYLPLTLRSSDNTPQLHPGFNALQYPADADFDPNLRIGLRQIRGVAGMAETDKDKGLTIVLRGAEYATEETGVVDHLGVRTDMAYLYLVGSDDGEYTSILNSASQYDYPVGWITKLHAEEYKEGSSFADTMQIRFDLSKALLESESSNMMSAFNPKEGYWYTFMIPFEEKDKEGNKAGFACPGQFELTMKVVPEYMIWEDAQKEAGKIGNWNNDGNWKRIKSGRINATVSDDNKDYFIDEKSNNRVSGFVPMLFTKVIMPENSKVELYAAGYKGNQWVTDCPTHIAAPTENIQYDLMTFESGDPLRTERYRVSLLDEIHFEPGSEMLHAEYLLYNKAWVDYQLTGHRWYMLASPLKAVVAGDFYTDSSTGTEGSEYFKDIKFNTTDNNRFKPSVYQRGWKGSTTTLQLADNMGTKDVAVAGNWSALYNDVAEAYTPGTGFSLKVQDLPEPTSGSEAVAKFRLPKADPKYSYYSYPQENQNPVEGVDIPRYTPGRLRSDTLFTRNTNLSDGKVGKPIEVTLSQNGDSRYYLVGNPFMAHLDMNAFFSRNTGFAKKYWLVTEGNQSAAVGTGSDTDNGWITVGGDVNIAPLQSFFVERTSGEGNVKVTFTQDMQTLGGTGDGLRSANALTITATTTDGRTSRAAVAYDMAASADYEASEDAELFLDSNLGDVPMVYTVAGTMATSINRTSELYNIPLGVYGSKQEMVTLSFGGLNQFSSATLYDAQEQTETPLHEGKTVSVPAGTSGRYFLRAGTPTGNEVIARNAFLVYSVGGGKVMVISSNTPLKDIRVYTMGGAQVRSIQASGMQQEIYLNRGIYLITVSDQDGLQETRKVLVR